MSLQRNLLLLAVAAMTVAMVGLLHNRITLHSQRQGVDSDMYLHVFPAPGLYQARPPPGDTIVTSQQAVNGDSVVNSQQAASARRKKIVYSCAKYGCGGWADRQKGLVSAYILASMLDRDFGVHIPLPCDLSNFMSTRNLDWRVTASELKGGGVQTLQKLDNAAVVFAKKLVSSPDIERELPSDVTVLTWNMEVVKYLRQHSLASRLDWMTGKTVPEIYREALNDLFRLNPELEDQLNTFKKLVPEGRKLVCAQVRMGRYPGFPDVGSWLAFEDFPVLANFLTKYNDSLHYRVLVTSDSAKIVQMATQKFPDVSISIPGPITHIDKSRGTDICDGFKKTILDEYALSTCDVLVISESGIGKVASFLRGRDDELYLFRHLKVEPFKREGIFPNKEGW